MVDNQLRFYVDQYNATPDDSTYRKIVDCISSAVGIRSIDSLIVLSLLSSSSDQRIATPAISAISNFYHESAVTSMVELVCSTKKKQYRDIGSTALANLAARCPEAKGIVEEYLSANCGNSAALKRFYRKQWQ